MVKPNTKVLTQIVVRLSPGEARCAKQEFNSCFQAETMEVRKMGRYWTIWIPNCTKEDRPKASISVDATRKLSEPMVLKSL